MILSGRKREEYRDFINACLKTRNSAFLNVKKEEDLYTSRQKSGTWMHRVLALKFAAWLNSEFELWVYATIDSIIFGKHVEREKSLERSIILQNEQNTLASKPDKTGEDFERYLMIERKLRSEQIIRKNLTKESISEMANLFADQKI